MRAAPEPAWAPSPEVVAAANATSFGREHGLATYADLHRWSVDHRADFWAAVLDRLGIVFVEPPRAVLATGSGPEAPDWLPGARLNIVASCFTADPGWVAVVHGRAGEVRRVTYGELRTLVDRVAHGFVAAGLAPGDRVAIAMPMTLEACAAYLGIVAAGGVVVSIADSFAPGEIATRLRIAGAAAVVTQDRIVRGGRELPMYAKVVAAGAPRAVVVDSGGGAELRPGDVGWADFLGPAEPFRLVPGAPGRHVNVLFSSGTTGDPKAIPWPQTAPIKAAMDGHFHHDIKPGDVVAWPTNLGWMMGPWLIFASLINRAAFALYGDVPTGAGFARFVQDAGVTMLGVVPSLVAAWRAGDALSGADWSAIRLFSSTGEASNAADVRWLMAAAGGRPVIEYCGGTEIAGGYVTGTVVQPALPGAFSTPALGLDFVLLDEDGRPTDSGEVFLRPPSIGLSTELLNRDHHEVYYAGTPAPGLRRHGDHLEALAGGYWRSHGRIDDTMNLGGIKVSSAEIERVAGKVAGVAEVAAVAVEPAGGGPSRLVLYVVPEAGAEVSHGELQAAIRADLNPLFKIHDVVPVEALPRTASAKVMRRELRARYRG